MVTDDISFYLLPSLAPIPNGSKSIRFNKIYISEWKSSLSEGNFSTKLRNNIRHLLLDTMTDSAVCFTMITDNISPNKYPNMVVTLLLVPLH